MVTGTATAVLQAFHAGARTFQDVVTRTGLARDVVSAAADQLVRMGYLEATELTIGCPPSGCGSCASGSASGGAGCGAAGPSTRRSGRAVVSIGLPRRRPTP